MNEIQVGLWFVMALEIAASVPLFIACYRRVRI